MTRPRSLQSGSHASSGNARGVAPAGRNKHQQPDSAQGFCDWRLDFPRANQRTPSTKRKSEQERADAEKLQGEVRDHGADHADPVAGRVDAGQDRGAIQRGIERRIRSQREEEEERGDAQQETDQLIEPPVGRRDKDTCQKIHVGRCSHGRKVPWRKSARAKLLWQEERPAATLE